MKLMRFVCVLLCGAVMFSVFAGGFAASASSDGTVPAWAIEKEQVYKFDFTETDTNYYAKHEAISLSGKNYALFEDGRLKCKDKEKFTLSSKGYLGDDFGITDGRMGLTLKLDSGKVQIRLRSVTENSGSFGYVYSFLFEDGNVKCSDNSNKTSYSISMDGYANEKGEYVLEFIDTHGEILVTSCGKTVVKVGYEPDVQRSVSTYSAKTTFYDEFGNVLAEGNGSLVQRAGSFSVEVSKLKGYIDDLYFNRTDINQSLPETDTERVVDYGNWVAADDLDRTTPLNNSVGDVKTEKKVGLFYFLCMTGAGIHIQDNTKIYLESGVDGLKSYLEKQGGEGYWAEPYFGYYRNTDTWVYRKHAYMLDAAGVDFIFLDVSNDEVFSEGHTALFDTWLQIRKEGGHTPQICFLTGDNPKTFENDVKKLKKTVYSEKNWDKYKELFFMWEGKPLIFGNITGVSLETKTYIKQNFTYRGCWAWCNKDGYWNWMDETWKQSDGTWQQYKGRDENGNFEQVSVTMGNHASSNKGRSYVKGVQPNNNLGDFMFTYDRSREGLCFADQFESAIKMDPQVIMITGWNEWIAGNCRGADYMALTEIKNVLYVDEFNSEFSRDGEPMKLRDGVGFGDNYYYQMVSYIRKFKGLTPLQIASGQGKEIYTADETAWADVGPEFRDTIGDAEFRNTVSYDAAYRYINGTGRNDFDYAKVTQDESNIYFMVKCVNDIISADDSTWMNLYINADFDHKTGWEGYEYVINRSRSDGKASVEQFNGTSWESVKVGDAEYVISGKVMVIKVRKSDIGLSAEDAVNFDFKWADNSTESGNVMEFMDLGDAAPNDRFDFRFVSDAIAYEKAISKPEKGFSLFGLNTAWSIVVIAGVAFVVAAGVIVFIIKKKAKKA